MMVIDCTFVCVFLVFVRIVLAEEESLHKLSEDITANHQFIFLSMRILRCSVLLLPLIPMTYQLMNVLHMEL